jgi:peptidoglycan/LPS O-acetylase OafA/YrhL
MYSKLKNRRDIQVLRGLAVIAVVLFHASKTNFPLGYLGVDIFFVISGFVMTPLILRIITAKTNGGRLSNLRYFYKRRFYRLAPALATTLATSAPLIFLFGPIVDHQRFARQGIATLLLLGNAGANRYSGDYFSPNVNPLVHTWSLAVEVQIFLILPIILVLILHNRNDVERITVILLAIILALSIALFLIPTMLEPLKIFARAEPTFFNSFYSPINRIWQFAFGSLGFLFKAKYQNYAMKFSKEVHLISAITIVLILFCPIQVNSNVSSILASLSALFVIMLNSIYLFPKYLIKKLEWIGDRSYSIYLVHMPVLYIAKFSPVTQIEKFENRNFQTIIAVFASLFFGSISYSKIEKNIEISSRLIAQAKNQLFSLLC